jgi:hypothetical protein
MEVAMILVRDIFQLKFGKAKDVKALWNEFKAFEKKTGFGPSRGLFDLVGNYYTFVMETTFADLSAYEKLMQSGVAAQEFGAWYQKFVPLVESGKREIFTIIE